MRTRMYGGVRGRKTKVGRKLTLFSSYSIGEDARSGLALRSGPGLTEKRQLSRRMSFMDYLKTSDYSKYLTTIP